MIRKKTFTTLCGIAILSGAAMAQVISAPSHTAPPISPGIVTEVPRSAHPESDRFASKVMVNMTSIGRALLTYAEVTEGPLPEHLGRIVRDVPSVEVFVTPGTRVPREILNGPSLQQSLWVQQHASYDFPGRGKNIYALSSESIILHEKLNLEPRRPALGVLFADGSARMVDRGTLEEMLKRP
jgi:hypothetical protein